MEEIEALGEEGKERLQYPETAAGAGEEPLPNWERFEEPEFDTVAYMNELFPTEQSLSNISAVAARCEYGLARVQEELAEQLRAAAERRRAGGRALAAAAGRAQRLAGQLATVDSRAETSAGAVREITAEMKQLDAAKVNLTAAMTALTHCHLLCEAASDLSSRVGARQYRDLLLPLQAATQVLQHFESYQDIKQVSDLRDQVSRIRNSLTEQIMTDFKDTYTGKGGLPLSALADVCAVADTLEPRVRRELLAWLVERELEEYGLLFAAEQEAGAPARVEGRYLWLKRRLLETAGGRGAALGPGWGAERALAAAFCRTTAEQLGRALLLQPPDTKLLLAALQATHRFEALLHRRFQEEDAQAEGSPWLGSISSVFEPHLGGYLSSLEQSLSQLVRGGEEEGGPGGGVYSSCADLFVFYKKCLLQCSQLSNGEPMVELAGLFSKYLREYARAVLQPRLPREGGGGMVSNLQLLLRDETPAAPRYSEQELCRIGRVVSTAEYCAETIPALLQKLRGLTRPELRDRVQLSALQDYHQLLDCCVTLLLQELEGAVSGGLSAMARASWSSVTSTGDSSPHVSALASALRRHVPPLREALAASRKYFTQLCIKFAESFIGKYIRILYKTRPSPAGAEQLLLDTHTLKSVLLALPGEGSEVSRPAPQPYTKLVVRLMARAEMILKLVLSPVGTCPVSWCRRAASLLPAATSRELRAVLDMKGVRLSAATLEGLVREANSEPV